MKIQYMFRFPDGVQESYDVQLDDKTLSLRNPAPVPLPAWTVLTNNQCANCPLNVQSHPHCPVAVGLVDVVARCHDLLSYDQVQVVVTTPDRTFSRDVTAQRGVSALMGLLIATSDCPHTSFFRPMARFHLPFASEEETIYRAASSYLLAQYFRMKQGRSADLELDGLKRIYGNMETVNQSMTERLRSASKEDSSVNALIILNLFAKTMPYAIEESLEEVRYAFDKFLDQR